MTLNSYNVSMFFYTITPTINNIGQDCFMCFQAFGKGNCTTCILQCAVLCLRGFETSPH